ncbi:hypothetical protein ABN763_01520 [Spongiivirga sp. MCCC 1A20706]|uniref:hypothetical protein n=1 Tax=Spongiivirga sp. MCCC 1A20706 TaxID=3160963 RepID=UPI00397739A1
MNNQFKLLSNNEYSYYSDLVFIILICTIPFATYLYLLAPGDSNIVDLGFTSFILRGYNDVSSFLWYISLKVPLAIYLGIWYLNETNRWNIMILVPFIFMLFQFFWQIFIIISDYQSDTLFGDFLISIPFWLTITAMLIVLKKMFTNPNERFLNIQIKAFLLSLGNSKDVFRINESWLNQIKKEKNNESLKRYLFDLLRIRANLDKHKIYDETVIMNAKIDWRRNLIVVLILVSIPFVLWFYKLAPIGDRNWGPSFLVSVAKSYPDVYGFLWYAVNKVAPILVLATWFFTSNKWWKNVILIPLAMYIFQLVSILSENVDLVDEYEYWKPLPIAVPIIILIVIISRKLKYFSLTKDLIVELEKEINHTLDQITNQEIAAQKQSFQDRLAALKEKKSTLTKDEYLLQMVKLRNEID